MMYQQRIGDELHEERKLNFIFVRSASMRLEDLIEKVGLCKMIKQFSIGP